MVEIKFDDYVINKYIVVDRFNNGLARVKDWNDLWGYIDKKGNEVIPCQFEMADDFSEELAIVYNWENQTKIINTKGEVLKETQYTQIEKFRQGFAAVKNMDGLWGYINKNFEEVIPCQFEMADDFIYGYAVVKQKDGFSYMDSEGELFGKYSFVTSFNDYFACIEENEILYSIDRKFQKQRSFSDDFTVIRNKCCGMLLWQNLNHKWGYLNEKLEPAIANMFDRARDFKEDVAIIEIKRIIGFVDKFGKITAFSKETQYTEIRDFSEGLAAVKNPEGLWGFIDKKGKEVIPCQYLEVDDFSEGLSGVLNTNGEFYYINKKGTIKISIDREYCSTLKLGDEEIVYINTTSKKELLEKKLEVLNQVKEEKIKQVIDDIADTSSDIMGDIYDLSKKRKRTNK